MANIKIELGHPIIDGMPLSFRAPCDCNETEGIKVIYTDGEDTRFVVFTFADAHGNDLTGIGNLFAKGAMVRVILDIPNAKAYIQNADTNAYLEERLSKAGTSGATVTAIDFSNFGSGSFAETVDGSPITHSVTFDDMGRPAKIDDIAITWGA